MYTHKHRYIENTCVGLGAVAPRLPLAVAVLLLCILCASCFFVFVCEPPRFVHARGSVDATGGSGRTT